MTATTTATETTMTATTRPAAPAPQTAAYRVRRLGRKHGMIVVRPVRVPIMLLSDAKRWAKTLLTAKGVYAVECLYSDYRYHRLATVRVVR